MGNTLDREKLIINADDFGLASHINKGIIEAIEQGAVNSVSIVANGRALDEAICFIQNHPRLKTGIHFTLIDEKPVAEPDLIPSLVTADGMFHRDYSTFIREYIRGRINPYEVKIELEAQLKKLLDNGLVLSHCDSHQHLHLLKRISFVVLRLCHTYWIPRVRIVNESLSLFSLKRLIPLIAMKYFSFRIRRRARLYNISTTDKFLGFNTSMNVTKGIIQKALSFSGKYFVELMCHPGFNIPDSGPYKKWGMDWDKERNTIIDNLAGTFL
ncbi:MAG: ChbG/HpnK family deacetylase [Spirochaetales bacterium]|nr:ChbG/HpnK family deacetylase [Spirochaetales bacterium]